MGIARQLHVKTTNGIVIHRPGSRLFSLTLDLFSMVSTASTIVWFIYLVDDFRQQSYRRM